MAEPATIINTPQNKFVGTTLFWIVSAVLLFCIAVVFFLHDKNLTQARDDFNKALTEQAKAQKTFTEEQTALLNKALTENVARIDTTAKKLSDEKDALAKSQGELAASYKIFTEKEYLAFKSKSDAMAAETRSDLTKTTQNVQKVEVDVKYLKENVEAMQGKLKGLDTQIGEIKTMSGDLKSEQLKLQGEIKNFGSRSDVTQSELESLVKRTNTFENKVLAEHAAIARKAAVAGNYKTFLEMVEFKNTQK